MTGNNVVDHAAPAPISGKKLYYTISEVSRLTGLKDSILRNWDKEFPQLRPKRSSSGVRSYKAKDIDLVLYIKRLLHEEKYTVSGAKQRIAEERRAERLGSGTVPAAVKREDPRQSLRENQREEPPFAYAPEAEQSTQSDSTPCLWPQPQDDSPKSSALPLRPAPFERLPESLSNIRNELAEILKILEP